MCNPNPATEGTSYDIPPLKVTSESLSCRYLEGTASFGEVTSEGKIKATDSTTSTGTENAPRIARNVTRIPDLSSWSALQGRLLERLAQAVSSNQ
jgi:hypothetical protein